MSSLCTIAVVVLIVLIACVALFVRTLRRWNRLTDENIRAMKERIDRD